MALCDQPSELLDHISSFIPATSDILSLGLTCKLLNAIVIPAHLEFRVVRCNPCRVSLWRSFAENLTMAATVLTLEIVSEPDSPLSIIVPTSIISSENETVLPCATPYVACKADCAQTLATAISKMHGLTRLVWDDTSFLQTHPAEPMFYSVRKNCPNLRELEITHFDHKPYFHSVSTPLWTMANLTRLSLTVTRPENVNMPAYEHFWALFAMLGRCPDLRDLRLAFESRAPIDICALFGTMSRPKLQRLILEGDYQPVPATTLNPFLLRHPSLEILSLMIPHDQPLPTMSHLRWLSARRLTREAFSQSEFPGLEYLVTWRSYIPTLIPRLHNIPLLRGATVNTDRPAALELFAQSVPDLERLVLAGAPWNTYRRTFGEGESRLPSPECLNTLAKFSFLTHLDSAAVIQEHEIHTGLPNILHELAAALPKLRYVCIDLRIGEAHSLRQTWYTLDRDSLGTLVSWEETRDLRLVRFHDWEDSFRHIGLW